MKITDLGSAKPDDPIYSSGLTIGGQRSAPSTGSPTDTDGTSPQSTKPDSPALPPPPERQDFKTQEQFEEALAYWQSHVGRIKALAKHSSTSGT